MLREEQGDKRLSVLVPISQRVFKSFSGRRFHTVSQYETDNHGAKVAKSIDKQELFGLIKVEFFSTFTVQKPHLSNKALRAVPISS